MRSNSFLYKLSWVILFGVVGFLHSCSQNSNSKTSKAFHNVTARYNAYFLARERMKEVEQKVWDDRKDDYNLILPVYHFVDSNFSKTITEDVEYIVEKATYPIKLHKNSNWVDDSYILIGRVRKYNSEMEFAVQTLKYVNTKSQDPDARHQALIVLMQCYTKEENYGAARKVMVFMENETLSEENEREYHLTVADYYRQQEEYEEMLVHIEKALPLMKGKGRDWKSRTYFIAGQLNQELGQDSAAFARYKQVLKHNPPYELEFHTKLNMAQVYPVENKKDIKKINKYFAKFLKDEKNVEYRDVIYYEKGRFEYRQGNTEKSLDLLEQSVHVDGARPLQQAYAYRMQGDIYYDREDMPKLSKYRMSKLYYDSTVQVMTSQIKDYEETIVRQDVLTRFVEELETVELEDSLQRLAKMDSVELVAYLQEIAAKETAAKIAEAERQKRIAEKQKNKADASTAGGFNTNVGFQQGNNFVFYNPSILQKSNLKFKERWGDRKLEDNWRRSTKDIEFTDEPEPVKQDTVQLVVQDSVQVDSAAIAKQDSLDLIEKLTVDPNAYWASIPFDEKAIAESNEKMEEALFKLGKILTFELEEDEYAIETFTKLNTEFPENDNYVETLYFLYILCQKSKSCDSDQYKRELIQDYPFSIYAKIAENPNYLIDYEDENKKSAREYEQAYVLYQKGRYVESNKMLKTTMQKYQKSEVMDKMAFLLVMTRAKMEDFSGYVAGLKEFKETFRTSPLVEYADELLDQEEELEKRGSLSVQEEFAYSPQDSVFYFVASFEKEMIDGNRAFKNVLEFNDNRYREVEFRSRKLDFSEKYFLIVIKEFASLEEAYTYKDKLTKYDAFRDYYTNDVVRNYYIISPDNFNVLLRKRNLEAFDAFYKIHY